MDIARDILPICDLDLLRSELIADPTRRGYGGLVAAWAHVNQHHRELLLHAIEVLLTEATLVTADGHRFSRGQQLGLRGVCREHIERVLDG